MSSIVIAGDSSGSVTLDAPAVSGNTVLTLPTTSGTLVTTAGAAQLTTSGNLNFTGTGNRITGDMSNATNANRVAFKTSTTNGNTAIVAFPNGTGNVAQLQLRSYDVDAGGNGNLFQVVVSEAVGVAQISTVAVGTGTALPMTLNTAGSESLRLSATSKAVILNGGSTSANGTGITFPAAQSASSDANTLDDYEEGEWTPSYTPTSGAFGTITYRFRQGRYTKVGRAVSFTCLIATDDIPIGTASGSVNISGLPFTNNDNENAYALSAANSFGANYPSAANTPASQNTIRLLYRTAANGTTTNFPVTSLDLTTDYGNLVQIAGTFFVA